MAEAATCKEFLQVQQEGSCQVSRTRKFYNLQVTKAVDDQLAHAQYEIFHDNRLAEEARNEALADDAELKRILESGNSERKDRGFA